MLSVSDNTSILTDSVYPCLSEVWNELNVSFMTKIYSSFLVCNAFEEISEFNGFLSSLDTENKLIFSCSVCTLFALKMMDRHTAALQHDLIRRYLIPIDKDMKIYPQIELFLFLKLKGDLLLNDSCVLNEIRDMIDEEEDIEDDFLAAYTESLFEAVSYTTLEGSPELAFKKAIVQVCNSKGLETAGLSLIRESLEEIEESKFSCESPDMHPQSPFGRRCCSVFSSDDNLSDSEDEGAVTIPSSPMKQKRRYY